MIRWIAIDGAGTASDAVIDVVRRSRSLGTLPRLSLSAHLLASGQEILGTASAPEEVRCRNAEAASKPGTRVNKEILNKYAVTAAPCIAILRHRPRCKNALRWLRSPWITPNIR